MAEVLFSAVWYRVATLRPRVRRQAQIHRHHYRGRLWYVLQDHASQRVHRFSPASYAVIGLMDGQRTVDAIWQAAGARLEDEAPTQDDVIQLLTQLHAADVLQCDVPPDVTELLLRYAHQRRRTWQRRLLNPLMLRLSLCDPERLLQRLRPWVQPGFSRPGLLLWLLVVGTALLLAAMHWRDLTEDMVERVLLPHNLVLLWLVFPALKTLHELGHACATKAYGGEVHDMGVMFLVFTPCPYVDASAAAAFQNKWHRIVVGAGGMLVELFLAALALFVWLAVEPGLVRTVAYSVMVIAGVSTVLFNGNPLMRYDGYYMLADYLEIPNLRARAHAYWRYLWERYACGQLGAAAEGVTHGERTWFISYGMAAAAYRLLVCVAVALFIADRFGAAGMVLAGGGLVASGATVVVRLLAYLSTSPRLHGVRLRAGLVASGLAGLMVWVVCAVPVPLRSRAEGVIWVPERALVRAAADGFVERLVASPGTRVQQGDVLAVCRDPLLETRVTVLEARVRELQVRYTVEWLKDVSQAEILKEELLLVEEHLARARQRVAALTIHSPTAGTFVVPKAQDVPGRFVKQGTHLGYVLDPATVTARVVVTQDDIDLVRQQTQGIEVRLAERLATPLAAMLWREVPAATPHVPSLALSSPGGGALATDPRDVEGGTTLQRVFQLDLHLPSSAGVLNVGGRVYVRFDHGREPLLPRWTRGLRRLLLARLYA